jgi:hypothetical protein
MSRIRPSTESKRPAPANRERAALESFPILPAYTGRSNTEAGGRAPRRWATQPAMRPEKIAEGIVGPTEWKDAHSGFCVCPGAHLHSTPTQRTDCKVVIAKNGDGPSPGIYCFHSSCAQVLESINRELRSRLGRLDSGPVAPRFTTPPRRPTPAPTFDPVKLEKLARRLEGVDPAWLAARSPKRTDNRTPASFLHELYRPGEQVLIFDNQRSQGQAVWTHQQPPFDALELDCFRTGRRLGVWFLAQPVTGEYYQNDQGEPSRRSRQAVTSWRYAVLESDVANPEHWLSALAQIPLPIAAIYTSGGKSIHALARIDAVSKDDWDSWARVNKRVLVILGADAAALSAVRLTRLPCCERLGTLDKGGNFVTYNEPRLQRLLYLDPEPVAQPICEKGVLRG